MLVESREPASNEVVNFNQLYVVLNGMRDEYNGQLVALRNEGQQAVIDERAATDERIVQIQAQSQQQINVISQECAQLREENQRLREEMGYVEVRSQFHAGRITLLDIENGLKKIKDDRKAEQHHLGCRVALLSFTIGVSASAVLTGAASTPFVPELGIPLVAASAVAVAGQSVYLRKFDVEWRDMKNLPKPHQLQDEKEKLLFPGIILLTSEQKKIAYDAVVADEAVRSAALKERLQEAEQAAERHIANNANTLNEIGNVVQGINNHNAHNQGINGNVQPLNINN